MGCPATTSGTKSADGIIFAGPVKLKGVLLNADGTNAATAVLYNNASAASGTVVAKLQVDAGLVYESYSIDDGVMCTNGLYLDITGTGAECIVHFEPA